MRRAKRSVLAAAILLAPLACQPRPAAVAPVAAAAVVPRPGEFVVGEIVVTLAPGVAAPEAIGDKRCRPGARASDSTMVIVCAPVGDAPEETARLLQQARVTAGVQSADYNWVRGPRAP